MDQRLYMLARTNGPIIAESFRHYGLVLSRSNDVFKVQGVIPNTQASAAKINPGDCVLRINGEPAAAWPKLRRKEFTHSLRVEIERAGQRRTMNLEKAILVE